MVMFPNRKETVNKMLAPINDARKLAIRYSSVKHIVLALISTTNIASAQNGPAVNVFFGFEFVLQPIAIKWACGGEMKADLEKLAELMSAFPEDSVQAELPSIVKTLSAVSSQGNSALADLLGTEISEVQEQELCAVALPLNIAWATPEKLASGDEMAEPSDQKQAWIAFYQFIEERQSTD